MNKTIMRICLVYDVHVSFGYVNFICLRCNTYFHALNFRFHFFLLYFFLFAEERGEGVKK